MFQRVNRVAIPAAVRKYVFARDQYQCRGCTVIDVTGKSLVIDHIIPLSKGGVNDLSNLQTLCDQCNQIKSNRIDSRFTRHFSGNS